MLQCWKYDPNERPSFTELVGIIQSQTTDVTNHVCELGEKSTDRHYSDIEADTDSSLPSTDSTCTSTKFHHKVKNLSTSSAETADIEVVDKRDYYYCSSSCMSDSSGGYLQFEEDESTGNTEAHHSRTKVYKTRNGSCCVTVVRTEGSDDSGIAMQNMEIKQLQIPPHLHTLHDSNADMVEGIV